jgi:hypothetical protein
MSKKIIKIESETLSERKSVHMIDYKKIIKLCLG